MKVKQDFVTNSSSTSFIFVFEGTKRKDLFKKLVENEEIFQISYLPYNGGVEVFDVWDLVECLIGLIKKGSADRWYMPEIYPMDKLVADLEREIEGYEKALADERETLNKEPKSGRDMYIFNHYQESLRTKKGNLSVLKSLTESGKKYSNVEVTFGNDGMIGNSFGYAMEGVRLKKDVEGFYMIVENQH